jgi:hypothetical protein
MSVAGRRPLLALRRRVTTLLSLGAFAGWPAPAFAQPGNAAKPSTFAAALVWSGPGPELTCLGEAGLTRAVNEYLGRDAFASTAAELVVHVNVERQPDRTWRALLELRDPANTLLGSRTLVSSDELCSSLNEPLVLAVALMVDSEPEPEPEPVQVPPPEPPPPEVRPERPRQHHALTLSADAEVVGAAGLLPSPSLGFELGLELGVTGWLVVRASGVGYLPVRTDLEGPADARFSFVQGNLALCPRLGLGAKWQLALCAGGALGALFAKSSGLEGARSTRRQVVGGTLELRANVRLGGRWSAVGHLGGLIPVRPERFVYEVNGEEHVFFQMAGFAPVAGIGASVMF